MKNAIKRAIEGGYLDNAGLTVTQWNLYKEGQLSWHVFTHDPKWWQALGKAEGWGDKLMFCGVCGNGLGRDSDDVFEEEWKYHWHRFIDHIAEGKDIDSFFNQLLK